MARFRSDFLSVLDERGYIDTVTDDAALDQAALDGRITGYIGFDCTADSLHVGSLVPIMLMRWLQNTGHRPLVLMGGGTTRIGDPSGKDETRQLLSDEKIQENMAGIRRVFDRFLTFGDGPGDAFMVNNADWLDEIRYIPFLRDVGRHFTINRMLTRDSVKLRLDREQPLTFLEFNYMLLQAYDFRELFGRYGCTLQMGGSDQWGNILGGVDLGRRMDGASLFGLTTPLITTADGGKMGKTAAGAVWLNEERLPAYDYWQFWRNTADADVERFLKLFTELPLDEIARLAVLEGQEVNEAKKILATEATAMCHGRAAADAAAATARETFEGKGTASDLPTIMIPADELESGLPAFALLARAGLVKSNGEGRRLLRQNGARLNDEVLQPEDRLVTSSDAGPDGAIKLSVGKKRHVLVRPA